MDFNEYSHRIPIKIGNVNYLICTKEEITLERANEIAQEDYSNNSNHDGRVTLCRDK